MEKIHVVFVCVGNMCRSQMAEGLARHLSAGRVRVESAGTHPSGRVSREAISCMAEVGVDLSGQRSKGLAEVDVASADVVVSMAPTPAEDLVPPGWEGQALDWEIGDPVGMPVEIFRIVRSELNDRVTEVLHQLGVKTFPLSA